VRVPQHVARVVVALGAQRSSDGGIVRAVHGAAAKGAAVFAHPTVAAAPALLSGPVHGAEGRGGQGHEEPRAVPDRGWDVLAAEEACANEVKGVARMEAGACRADGCAAVAAADEEAFTWFVPGVVVVENFPRCGVQGRSRAGQVDGVCAATGSGDLVQPARELRVLGETNCVTVRF
jgi:hypothetical protein